MAITTAEAPRPGPRPKAPPAAAAAATPTRSSAPSQASQSDDQIGDLLGQPNGRPSEQPSARPQRRIGQGGQATRLARGDEGAIRDKVKQCWNVDAAALNKPVVQIRVAAVQPDGTILPKDVSIADNGGDPAWANAARRAVANPACQPWPMPGGGWPNDTFLLVFDPKDMF
ncbi:TonB C-terminal domain-containing protein [Inquilinus sp. 2KB_23]